MHQRRVLIGGGIGSICLLAVFFGFQRYAADLLQMPTPWLLVALTPLLVGVVAGGYIGKLRASASGFEFETQAALRGAPEEIRKGEQVGVTKEGLGGLADSNDVTAMLAAKEYPQGIVEDLYLLHEASVTVSRTSERRGLFRVRVWLEAYRPSLLDDVERVSYRLYNDEFPRAVVATAARANGFELWLNVYGEFTVVACVQSRGKPAVWLTRYLDLPGRPPE